MGLHHLATIWLFVGCYLLNGIRVGTVISFLHDLSDIPGMFCKALSCTRYDSATATTFLVTVATWIYVRNYCFTSIIYSISQAETNPFHPYPSLLYIFIFLLSCLCVLHFYWVCMFFRLLHGYATKGATEDCQNKVELDGKQKKQ